MPNTIEISNAKKIFGKNTVLDGLSLTIPQGKVIGLLGKNGAGKTTLIKAILGLLKLNDGTIRILGENAFKLSGNAKESIGYVPQVVSLYNSAKVYQLINYTGSFFKNWDYAYADKLVADWKLDKNEKVGALSVGQKQKLAIILAIAKHPDLIILDEPVASLDPAARKAFVDTISDYAKSGKPKTVIFATHIISDLEKIAADIVILDKGKVIFNDNINALKAKYAPSAQGENVSIEDIIVKIYE